MRLAVIFNERNMHEPGGYALKRAILRNDSFDKLVVDLTRNPLPSRKSFSGCDSVLLIGDFSENFNYRRSGHNPYLPLIELWKTFDSIPKSWLTFADLHHGMKKILFGRSVENNTLNVELESFTKYFSETLGHLFWKYEGNSFSQDYDDPARPELRHSVMREIKSAFTHLFPRRVDTPKLICASEFITENKVMPAIKRPNDIFVPGRNYQSRDDFVLLTLRLGLKSPPYKFYDRVIRKSFAQIARFHVKQTSLTALEFWFRYQNQRYWTHRSRMTYTDGNHLDYFVRKFIEIPSSGGILITPSTEILKYYGFTPWIHYIPSNELVEASSLNPFELDEIGKSCREHVKKFFDMDTGISKVLMIAGNQKVGKGPNVVRLFPHGE